MMPTLNMVPMAPACTITIGRDLKMMQKLHGFCLQAGSLLGSRESQANDLAQLAHCGMSLRRARFSCRSRAYPILRNSCSAGLLVLLGGCHHVRLPDCVVGKPAPNAALMEVWRKVPKATRIDVAIDGSGSMQGLTGSPKASAAWKALLKGVTLAAASAGQPIQALRSGSGQLQPLTNVSQAAEPCFFSGCGAYASVSSSLDAVWKGALPAGPGVPMKVAISDLEVNAGDISGLVAAIKPHTHMSKGAVIGVLAVKLPFQGSVYNSQSEVVHTGQSQRPIYLLATGPQAQLKAFLNDVRTKAALGGVPTDTMQLTFLDEHVNRPTLKAASVQGVPPQAINSGLPIRLANSTYSPGGQPDFQFVKLLSQAEGVRLSSSATVGPSQAKLPEIAVVQVEPVVLPGAGPAMGSGVSVRGLQLQGQQLVMELAIPGQSPAGAVRATVPRGQLPEDWWISWNRREPSSSSARDQTDGLLLLLTSLGSLLVELGSTPAAAFCLAFSH